MILPAFTCLLNILIFSSEFCLAIDNFTSSQLLKDPNTIVSNNSFFRLGFFSPPNSTYRYVGIWYNYPSIMEVIWVANRNNPDTDSSGSLKLSVNGNLIITNARNHTIWSSNFTNPNISFSVAQISDYGSLVIEGFSTNVTSENGTVIWQSSQHATDSFLPNMGVLLTPNSDLKSALQAWSSPSDPSIGRFSIGISSIGPLQIMIYDGDQTYWRSGPWNGNLFIGTRYHNTGYGNILVNTGSFAKQEIGGMLSITFDGAYDSLLSHYVLTYEGKMAQRWWHNSSNNWKVSWQAPNNECDAYAKCGEFGICSPQSKPICSCLKGFVAKNIEEWNRGNWTSGCQRRKPLQCSKTSDEEDGFLRLKMIKVPENAELNSGLNLEQCKNACLKNCSCLAYTYDTQISCLTWSKNLTDVADLSPDGVDLYLRLAQSELSRTHRWKIVIVTLVISVMLGMSCFIYCFRRWIIARYGNKFKSNNSSMHNIIKALGGEAEFQDLPFLKFEILVAATNNFDLKNKLGQGGFGPVYKGTLENGKEIAVKRLSKASGQGQREFLNEVIVISKLQHKNLVRLLGCSLEKEEKLLVYEFMQNKSLDVLLFDPYHRGKLDWQMRFNIIKGVCRGVLYLHRDSRLKIIHRDIKASNILLDKELNPKISDFGMARIFGGKQDQANTLRVVGTYGYMSPEYAMEGRFSEKSDVFSLGVLLLEIVSGQRNGSIQENSISLISYAWKMWNEDNINSLIDPIILNPCQDEIFRSIQVGLLCVQEFPEDRPNISTMIEMLESEGKYIPRPLQPGFTQSRTYNVVHDIEQLSSTNYASISSVHGR